MPNEEQLAAAPFLPWTNKAEIGAEYFRSTIRDIFMTQSAAPVQVETGCHAAREKREDFCGCTRTSNRYMDLSNAKSFRLVRELKRVT